MGLGQSTTTSVQVLGIALLYLGVLNPAPSLAGGEPKDPVTKPPVEVPSGGFLQPAFQNLWAIEKALGFDRMAPGLKGKQIHIAIIDKGFTGAEQEIGVSLPRCTEVIGNNDRNEKSDHGLKMAQIVTGLLAPEKTEECRLRLTLLSSQGYTQLQNSVAHILKVKPQVVLYSEVWEFGNNFDQGGFINALTRQVAEQGILWVNAAGNFHGRSWTSGITIDQQDSWVRLPGANNGLEVVCEPVNKAKTCQVRSVMSWNAFADDINRGTNQDLDFILLDEFLNTIAVSQLRQKAQIRETSAGVSLFPREIIEAELKPGRYFLKVKALEPKRFNEQSRLRILLDGLGLSLSHWDQEESLTNPADSPHVLTVGAIDSERSSFSRKWQKPEILTMSRLVDQQGNEFRGSSNAAAIVASFAAGILAINQDGFFNEGISIAELAELLVTPKFPGRQWDVVVAPNGLGCFPTGTWRKTPEFLKALLPIGARVLRDQEGWFLALPFGVEQIAWDQKRQQGQHLFISEEGWHWAPAFTAPEVEAQVLRVKAVDPRRTPLCSNRQPWFVGVPVLLPFAE